MNGYVTFPMPLVMWGKSLSMRKLNLRLKTKRRAEEWNDDPFPHGFVTLQMGKMSKLEFDPAT